ncbi:RdgB/HAM1 family non-canonical purine NTP pyrophosphatase [Spiroplasma alleghenense]|uniref:dITP/XTP pyrophosphatase n=1 Tax=Spiroplasma alleghenense TaxID=216931 RepID=A0A345Z3R7_9MOLU|nr:RdgB/HAM1 family non-canonical purine NTP pyrophosphatase [Spiroplasma alleghenense]AXK51246.1 dITP/XTP pyrophosphatase [Spiroplasma alleghenense]
MKKNIWVATANINKVEEFKVLLPNYEIKSLLDFKEVLDIPEDFETFEENALFKAQTLYDIIDETVIADDSGLCIFGLDNFPGVKSARWASPEKDWNKINDKLLEKMLEHKLNSIDQRQASFVTVIAIFNKKLNIKEVFRGEIQGTILTKLTGNQGFGYDPIFAPSNHQNSFAQMSTSEKNKYSHRAIACQKLREFLDKI